MSVFETIERVTDSATGIVRLVVMVFTACMATFALFSYYTAQNAVAEIGERAERVGKEAVEAARVDARNAELAREGWGYETGGSHEPSFSDERDHRDNDWGRSH